MTVKAANRWILASHDIKSIANFYALIPQHLDTVFGQISAGFIDISKMLMVARNRIYAETGFDVPQGLSQILSNYRRQIFIDYVSRKKNYIRVQVVDFVDDVI